MKKIRLLLIVILFILVLGYALVFASANSQAVALDFIIGSSVSLPVALWLGLALMVGVVAGMLTGMLSSARHRVSLRLLRKELGDTRQRLNKLP